MNISGTKFEITAPIFLKIFFTPCLTNGQYRSLSRLSFSRWNVSASKGSPLHLIWQYPFIHLGGRCSENARTVLPKNPGQGQTQSLAVGVSMRPRSSPPRACTQTTQSGVQRANHKPPRLCTLACIVGVELRNQIWSLIILLLIKLSIIIEMLSSLKKNALRKTII